MDEFSALLEGLPPEVLDQLLSLQTAGQDYQSAAGMMDAPMRQHSTFAGGLLGGLGQGLGNMAGRVGMKQAQGKQTAGMQALIDLLRGQQQPEVPDVSEPIPF